MLPLCHRGTSAIKLKNKLYQNLSQRPLTVSPLNCSFIVIANYFETNLLKHYKDKFSFFSNGTLTFIFDYEVMNLIIAWLFQVNVNVIPF